MFCIRLELQVLAGREPLFPVQSLALKLAGWILSFTIGGMGVTFTFVCSVRRPFSLLYREKFVPEGAVALQATSSGASTGYQLQLNEDIVPGW
jgi:hypothetical protein